MATSKDGRRLWRGIVSLGGGVLGAQLITLVCVPLISRLYTPEQFGLLALVISIASVLAPLVTLRLESALLLPESKVTASAILYVSVVSTITLSALATAVLWLLQLTGVIEATRGSLLMPVWVGLITFLSAMFTLVGQFALRRKRYAAVAQRSVVQSAAINGAQVGLGIAGAGSAGLLLGATFGRIFGVVPLLVSSRSELRRVDAARMLLVVREYWRFPVLFTTSGVLNSFGLQAPILFASLWFSASEVGQLGMAERVLFIPLTIVGGAVAQVLEAEVSERLRTGQGGLREIFMRLTLMLLAIAVLLVVLVLTLSEAIVPLLLGNQWRTAGSLILMLVIPVAMRLVASPMSRVLIILQRGRTTLILDIVRVLLVFAAAGYVMIQSLDFVAAMTVLYAALGVTYILTWGVSFGAVSRLPLGNA